MGWGERGGFGLREDRKGREGGIKGRILKKKTQDR